MKVAVMQPYFFPFSGYFELIFQVDKFVFLDDVNFIKRGFINRNSLLFEGRAKRFCVPVAKMSQNRKINEHVYLGDYQDFLGLVENAYSEKQHFSQAYKLLARICSQQDNNVASKNIASIEATTSLIGIETQFLKSSDLPIDRDLRGQDKIIAICKTLGADTYINPVGGSSLYDKNRFNDSGIRLEFFEPTLSRYPQGQIDFISHLSIVDLIVSCSPKEAHGLIATRNI